MLSPSVASGIDGTKEVCQCRIAGGTSHLERFESILGFEDLDFASGFRTMGRLRDALNGSATSQRL